MDLLNGRVIRAIACDQARELYSAGARSRRRSFGHCQEPVPKLAIAGLRVGLIQLLGALKVIVPCGTVDLFVSVLFQDLGLDSGRP